MKESLYKRNNSAFFEGKRAKVVHNLMTVLGVQISSGEIVTIVSKSRGFRVRTDDGRMISKVHYSSIDIINA